MKKYRKLFIILAFIVLTIVVTVCLLYKSYISPVSNNKTLKEVTIKPGMSSREIAKVLKEKNLVKDTNFFVFYLKLNSVNDLKAGTYELSENMSLKNIVKVIQEGNNYNKNVISMTFKEGINFREIAKVISENTNNTSDDVLNTLTDKEYLQSLIEDYWFITDDILNPNIYYPLEGYLFPDTYEFRSKEVTVHEIFKKLLDQMEIVLEPYKDLITARDLSVHELLTLASIAEKEVNQESDRAKVISVFLNRLLKKMPLGSDVTTRYGLKLDDKRALTSREYESSNPYNTRNPNFTSLPAGPIGMVSKSSIEASIKPENTDYLYFISNIKTNETFFFTNSRDFETKKQELNSINNGY